MLFQVDYLFKNLTYFFGWKSQESSVEGTIDLLGWICLYSYKYTLFIFAYMVAFNKQLYMVYTYISKVFKNKTFFWIELILWMAIITEISSGWWDLKIHDFLYVIFPTARYKLDVICHCQVYVESFYLVVKVVAICIYVCTTDDLYKALAKVI